MADLRLAYLVSRYPALSHTFILREVRGLRALGIEVEVASVNPADRPISALAGEEREESSRTLVLKQAGVLGVVAALGFTLRRAPAGWIRGLVLALREGDLHPRRTLLWLAYLAEALVVGRWMHERGLAHLHVHFATPAASVALLASRVFGIDFSIMVHGPDEFYDVSWHSLPRKLAAASFLCCIGLFARGQLMRLLPPTAWRKLEISRLGVDPARFSPAKRSPRRGKLDVLCVGRLVPQKGQRVLLEAVAGLVRRNRDVSLCYVGEGPDREALESRVAELGLGDRVRFAGGVNQDEILPFYSAADAFALVSFAEGIPVVLMEAMAMELPCVTTFTAGIPELVRDGVDGLLVAQSDVEGTAAALERLLDDPDLRVRLGASGRARVVRDWRLDASVERLAEIFRHRVVRSPDAVVPRGAREGVEDGR
ncbi:phosphatidyl-myo-inositol dimannoside synthase [Myxococcaceae bacterium]|jgi:glycosyltransferase involved in cell wall biosynthesis|nr:phosphatidyl-myo-inositol dimannoside synthase [Myxococcaceae bacterium]